MKLKDIQKVWDNDNSPIVAVWVNEVNGENILHSYQWDKVPPNLNDRVVVKMLMNIIGDLVIDVEDETRKG